MAAMAADRINQSKLNGDFHSDSNLTHPGGGNVGNPDVVGSNPSLNYNQRKAAVVRARLAVPGGQRLLLKVIYTH